MKKYAKKNLLEVLVNKINRLFRHSESQKISSKNFHNLGLSRTSSPLKIVFANSVPAFKNSAIIDSIFSEYLSAAGHDVRVLVCDGVLSACLNCKFGNFKNGYGFIDQKWKLNKSNCTRCRDNNKYFNAINSKLIQYSQYWDAELQSVAEKYMTDHFFKDSESINYNGINLLEHAKAGTIRFFAKGRPEGEQNYELVLRNYVFAAYQTAVITERFFDEFKPDVIVAHHGIYVPQGIIVDIAKSRGIRVVTWTPSYRKGTFMFCEGDTYHKIMPRHHPATSVLSEEKTNRIASYINSRASASSDWIWFNKNSDQITPDLREHYLINKETKIIALYTNVFWDAQLHFDDAIYSDMLEWLEDSIKIFSNMENVHLLIRTHPAEVSGFIPSRQRIDSLLENIVKDYPNITIIRSDDKQCSYALAKTADLVIVYGSKIAIELAAIGKNVIVCGEAWARGKGFTFDIESRSDYETKIRYLLAHDIQLDDAMLAKARSYAYWFFFQKMIPVEVVEPTGRKIDPFIRKEGVDLSYIEKSLGFQTIVLGIINKGPFQLDDNQLILERKKLMIRNDWFNVNEISAKALRYKNEIHCASERVAKLGLKSHHDNQKDWDTLLTFMAINTIESTQLRGLDAGSGQKSVILQWVRTKFPDAELHACDRVKQKQSVFKDLSVKFSVQDMSNTNYADSYFDFVSSISVIEHGVDVFSFIKEMHRILKPSGILTISTDYWDEKRVFPDKFPYGEKYGSMKLFSKDEILGVRDYAKSIGFELINDLGSDQLDCCEKAVRWERMQEDYTFCFLPFRKRPAKTLAASFTNGEVSK
jgi:SAM-dependent methyltransferase